MTSGRRAPPPPPSARPPGWPATPAFVVGREDGVAGRAHHAALHHRLDASRRAALCPYAPRAPRAPAPCRQVRHEVARVRPVCAAGSSKAHGSPGPGSSLGSARPWRPRGARGSRCGRSRRTGRAGGWGSWAFFLSQVPRWFPARKRRSGWRAAPAVLEIRSAGRKRSRRPPVPAAAGGRSVAIPAARHAPRIFAATCFLRLKTPGIQVPPSAEQSMLNTRFTVRRLPSHKNWLPSARMSVTMSSTNS